MIDKEHSTALCLFPDNSLGLTLGTDKHNRAAIGNHIKNVVIRLAEQFHGRIKVYDMNTVTRTVDIGFHLRIPAPGLVTKMQTSL